MFSRSIFCCLDLEKKKETEKGGGGSMKWVFGIVVEIQVVGDYENSYLKLFWDTLGKFLENNIG